MHLFSRRGGLAYFKLGEVTVELVPPPLAGVLSKRLREGASLVVVGPHGVGKSVAVGLVAYAAAEEGAVVIDLASDTSTFAEYLRLARRAGWAFAVFDALPPQFYAEPEVWSEQAALWRDSCGRILARADYVRRLGFPSVVVLPTELAVRCRSELAGYERLAVEPDAGLAREIFAKNSDVYCGADYADAVVERVSTWGEGVAYMALHAAKALQFCDEDPRGIADRARDAYAEKLAAYVKILYAPSCSKARRFVSLLAYRHLPPHIASQAAHYEAVESRVRTLEKLLSLADKLAGPHREYVKILALQSAEELKRLMRPGWVAKSIEATSGGVYEEVLKRVEEEVRRQCGIVRREVNLRVLAKAFVIVEEAYNDLAKATVALAMGQSPCVGKMAKLCRGGAMDEALINALIHPIRLSAEAPPSLTGGLEYYAGKRAEEVGEKGWLEVLNALYEAAERHRVDLRPFRDYVELALTRGNLITKRLALALVQSAAVAPGDAIALALKTAVELGEDTEALAAKYVEAVGDAGPIYEKCGVECREVVVEVAVASAAKAAAARPCQALRQMELALESAGYGQVVKRYKPSERCSESI